LSQLTLSRSVEILREHAAASSSKHVDLCISLRVCDVDTDGPDPVWLDETDEELVRIGGRWDRRKKKWIGDAKDELVVIRVPRGSDQEQPARWLAEWFRRYATGPKGAHWDSPATIPGRLDGVRWGRKLKARISIEFRRVWTLMLVGGRRGGKSHLAVVALIMMMVLTPRAREWAISPTQVETDELEQAFRELVPTHWYTERLGGAGKDLQFKLVNGSRLLFLSGFKPRSLKRGRCDMALLNEAQNMYRATWRQLRGAIADRAGLVLLACNPPDEKIGRWIDELADQIRATRAAHVMGAPRRQREVKAEMFHHTGKANPFVTEEALADMRAEVDDITAAREIDGELGIPIGDVVFHAWSPDNIRAVPDHFVDITAEVTKREFGRAAGFVVGMDFQRQPHEAAGVFKFFRDPDAPDPNEIIPWLVDGVLAPDANEEQLLDSLERMPRWSRDGRDPAKCYRGWIEPDDSPDDPAHCAVVMDASAWWQDSEHQKGKRSDKILQSRRWTFLYKPQKDSNANPVVAERCKVTNSRLKQADTPPSPEHPEGIPGRRRAFVCPHVLEFIRALAQWENNPTTGQPSRDSEKAHAGDAFSYVIYRFFGIPGQRRRKLEYRGVGRFDRGDDYPSGRR
jgi:hypothetical protein